jgi:multisubunit Na+/H+ antiporter MnhG subunit
MTGLIADILIYLLLIAGVGFGGIALMGLLIFPDLHSRLFTGLRASLICGGSVLGAAIVYGIFQFMNTGGDQYAQLALHAIILAVIIVIGVTVTGRLVRDKTKALAFSGSAGKE